MSKQKMKKIGAKQHAPTPEGETVDVIGVTESADAPAEPVVAAQAVDPARAEAAAPPVVEVEAPWE